MIIKVLELTHFGGLAKVLIHQPTENGALKSSDTHSTLTMQYLTLELKSCAKEQRRDSETGLTYNEISERPLINFELEYPFSNERENIFWRTSIWNLAVYRSLEIWKSLPNNKIEKSIGTLSDSAKKSLKGKLGAGNKHYFKKDENGNWTFIKFKETKYESVFKPFSESAINICKNRARGK
jgi:hypothetical protein